MKDEIAAKIATQEAVINDLSASVARLSATTANLAEALARVTEQLDDAMAGASGPSSSQDHM